MSDLFDYMFFYLASGLLAVCNIAGFISISWWWVLAPTLFALFMFVISMFVRE